MHITELIPQRDPFLFVENYEYNQDNKLKTYYTFKSDIEFFKGHFPGEPIVPGVILSEHCFQSAAALMALKASEKNQGLTVLSRIQSAKFKNLVTPETSISTETELIEQMDNAAFFKSIVKNQENKKVLIIEFACTLISQ